MLEIEKYLKEIEDPRSRKCPHEFRDIVLIAICSSICGYLEWEDMELYAEMNKKWLKKKLKLKFISGIPSKFNGVGSTILSSRKWLNFVNTIL